MSLPSELATRRDGCDGALVRVRFSLHAMCRFHDLSGW